MSDNSKLKVVSNIEQRIDDVLNDLNKGMNVQDTAATEVLELFKPDATFYKEYFKNNPNSKYIFKDFSIPYAVGKDCYVNYFCHTYLAIIPKGFETFLEGLDFHSFEDDSYYQDFVSENASEYYEHISEKKNTQRFIENTESNDVDDLRHKVSLTGFNYDQILNESFDSLLRGEL